MDETDAGKHCLKERTGWTDSVLFTDFWDHGPPDTGPVNGLSTYYLHTEVTSISIPCIFLHKGTSAALSPGN